MKVTKEQKILGGVLILAVIALGMDRFVFPAPGNGEGAASAGAASAGAAATSEYTVDRSAAAVTSLTAPTLSRVPASLARGKSLAQRLRDAGASIAAVPTRDAFAIPAAWAPAAPRQPDPAEQLAEKFRQTHRLTGVLESADRSVAMVDGNIVGPGQSLDGFTLVAVSHRSAIFQCGAQRIVLTLSDRDPGSTSVAGANP